MKRELAAGYFCALVKRHVALSASLGLHGFEVFCFFELHAGNSIATEF